MLVLHQQSYRHWVSLGILSAFLGFLLQPQVGALYHVHTGGDHAHIHTSLLVSPVPPHYHHHNTHSHLKHAGGALPIRHAPSHSAMERKTPAIRHAHTRHNGHWHASVAFHLTNLPSIAPDLLALPAAPLPRVRNAASYFSSPPQPHSRGPPPQI